MPKTYTPISHGQLSNPSQLNELYQDVAVLTAQVFNVKESTFGAVMNGTADDGDALRAAITAADVVGGTVYIPHGPLAFTGAVQVPAGVNIWGAGGNTLSPCTTLKALNSAAKLSFGAQEDGGTWGGMSGNFLLDGDNLSANMLYLGRTLERVFLNIGIIDCAAGGYAVTIEEAQNNQFIGLVMTDNRGGGISFDRGCAHNRFFGVEARANGIAGGYHVRFTATDATVASLVPYPFSNTFYDSVFEDDGGLLTGGVYHGAGQDNAFIRCNIAAGAAASRVFPLVLMEVGNAGITSQSTRLSFHNCQFTGTQTQTTGIDLNNASIVDISGKTLFSGLLDGFRLRDATSQVWTERRFVWSNVTNRNSASSVGILNNALRNRLGDQLEVQRPLSTDAYMLGVVEGEAGMRLELRGDGVRFMDGSSFTPDTVLQRLGANVLSTAVGDQFSAGGSLYSRASTTQTGNYTALATDYYIVMNNSGASATVTLPAIAGLFEGFEFLIKRISTQNVVIDPNSSEAFEDAAITKTITTQYGYLRIRKRGTVWDIVGSGGTIT